VRLHEADDDVRAAFESPPGLPEHREGLADARSGPEVYPQLTAPGHAISSRALVADVPELLN
jgi:hypothetical protein